MSGNLIRDARRGNLGARVLLGGPAAGRGGPPPAVRGGPQQAARVLQAPPAVRGGPQSAARLAQAPPVVRGGPPPGARAVTAFRGPVAAAPVLLPPVFSEREALTQETAVRNFTRERREGRTGEAAIIPKRYLTAVHALNNLLQETKFVWIQGSPVVEVGEQINLEGVYPNARSRRITAPNMIEIIERLGFSSQRFEWTEAPLLATTMNHDPDIIGAIIEIKQGVEGDEYHWMSITKNNTALHRPVCGPGYKWAYFNSLTRKRITCDDNLSNIYSIFSDPTKDLLISTVIIVRNNRRPVPQFRVVSGPSNNSNVENYDEDEGEGGQPNILGRLEEAARFEVEVNAGRRELEVIIAQYDAAVDEIEGDEAAIQGTSDALRSAAPGRRIVLQQEIQQYRADLEAAKQKKQAAIVAASKYRNHPHLRSMMPLKSHTLLSQGLLGGRRKTRRRASVRQTRRIKRVHH